jgi:hypothetical protein
MFDSQVLTTTQFPLVMKKGIRRKANALFA